MATLSVDDVLNLSEEIKKSLTIPNSDTITLSDWTNPHLGTYGDSTFPSLTCTGIGGLSVSINIELPEFTCDGKVGECINGELSGIICEGYSGTGASGDIIISSIYCIGKTGENINAIFPVFTGNITSINGTIINSDTVIPVLTCEGQTYDTNKGNIKCSFPSVECSGIIFDLPIGNITASLPSLIGNGISRLYDNAVLSNTETLGICLNTEINAVSQYAGFSFDSMCVFNGKIIGAGETGIYEHDGDNDGTNSILAFFELFSTDLGTTKQKRLKRIFINGEFMGFLQATSIFDSADKTNYSIICPPVLTTTQLKVPLNYTDNGETISLKISNIDGSDFSVDSITADVILLSIPAKQYNNIGRVKSIFPSIVGA